MLVKIADYSETVATERIDAQFFRPEYVNSHETVTGRKHDVLSDIAHISDGNHLKISEQFDNTDGVRYLRGQDLGTDMMLHDRNIVFIPEAAFNGLKRSHIHKDDILITIVGANTGLVGLAYDPPAKLVANCKLGIARADKSKVNPGYLYSFLICRYGQHQMLRSIRGGGQTGLILPDMRTLRIVRLGIELEEVVSNVAYSGHQRIIESKRLFAETHAFLLKELGLGDWEPKHQLAFTKSFSEVQNAKRMDAEYYQPKYDEIVNAIKGYAGGWDTLGNLVIVKKCVEVGSDEYLDEGIPFVRVSNLSPFEITDEKHISEELYAELKKHQPQKGEHLFSKDATPGIPYYLREQPPQMIPSGGILRLKRKSDRINDDYLMLVLNSLLTKEQVNRDCGGSVILHWRPDQVKETLIPILSEDKQAQIQEKVVESFALRKQSTHLLESAKRAVEIAIEKSESDALSFLEKDPGVRKSCNR